MLDHKQQMSSKTVHRLCKCTNLFFFFPFCGLAACGHLVAGLAFAHAREMFHTRALAYILQMQTVILTHAFASFVTVTGGFPSSILL